MNPYSAPTVALGAPETPDQGLGWLLFSLRGRIRRRQYWFGSLLMMLFLLFGGVGAGLATYSLRQSGDGNTLALLVLILVVAPLILLAIWWSFALSVKRWHDRNKSGLWVLIGLIPYIGSLWAFIENGCLPGTEGPNDYGPDPRQ
jgi:uncharacterized membrane protein YhaH (DUF805 family)